MTGITATQSSAWVPGVAADFSWLPPGTVVEVPGYGKETIDDTGGKLKRRWWNGTPRLDVRFPYHWEARNWGIQYLDVKVWRK
jgi:3D (Asp-Asp-Asp) domain-containing protein